MLSAWVFLHIGSLLGICEMDFALESSFVLFCFVACGFLDCRAFLVEGSQ